MNTQSESKKRKKIPPKAKKTIDIVVTVLEVLIVLVAIVFSAIVIANPTASEVSGAKIKLLPVLSDSMKGDNPDSFEKGDLVIAKTPDDVYNLKEGQIITFRYNVAGQQILNTHRIIEVRKGADGKAQEYVTHGDNNPAGNTESVLPYNVLAVYSSHMKGVGKAIVWLQEPTHFLLVIVLPLGILFIYNIVMFVMMIMSWKVSKAKTAAKEAADLDEEEIKRKAIEEYLAKQNADAPKSAETPAESTETPVDAPSQDKPADEE